jgi:very-short-patch-repair endonuclease
MADSTASGQYAMQNEPIGLEHRGFRVVRFWNDEVLKNGEAVIGAVWQALAACETRPPPSPSPFQGEGNTQ